MSKKQLGVLFGSRSCEREVSIISAVQMMRHADPEKYDVIPVYIDEHGAWYTGEKLKDIHAYQPFQPNQTGIRRVFLDMTPGSGALLALEKGKGLFGKEELKAVARVDVFVIVMHGMNGEDGTIQGMLELANVPYSAAGVGASSLGMDKILMKQYFRGGDLPVLPSAWYTLSRFEKEPEAVMAEIEGQLDYPVYVKPANLGSSIGVSRGENRQELREAMELAFEYDRRVLVEKGLNHPIELNCSVLGYDDEVEASPLEMPLGGGEFLGFQEKYLADGGSKGMASLHRVLPAPIEDRLRDRIQEMSKRIFRMMDCKGAVRIDYMFDRESENVYITEINTIPGSLAFYLWESAGMPYRRLIDRLVEIAERARADRNAANYAYTSDILKGVSFGAKGAKGSKGASFGAKGSKGFPGAKG